MTKVSLQAFVKNWRALIPRKLAAKAQSKPFVSLRRCGYTKLSNVGSLKIE